MALNGIIDASLFPLKSTSDVVNLFRRALTSAVEPDLTLLSIVVGYIELSLTTGEAAQAAQAAQATLGAYTWRKAICKFGRKKKLIEKCSTYFSFFFDFD